MAGSATAQSILDREIDELITASEPNDIVNGWLRCMAVSTIERYSVASKSQPKLQEAWEAIRRHYSDRLYASLHGDDVVTRLLAVDREYIHPMQTEEGWKRLTIDKAVCRDAICAGGPLSARR